MIKNTRGVSHGWLIIGLLIIIFVVYGYYGYIYVPQQSSYGQGPPCPFGQASGLLDAPSAGGFGASTGPCAYSLLALIIGILIIVGLIAHHFIIKR